MTPPFFNILFHIKCSVSWHIPNLQGSEFRTVEQDTTYHSQKAFEYNANISYHHNYHNINIIISIKTITISIIIIISKLINIIINIISIIINIISIISIGIYSPILSRRPLSWAKAILKPSRSDLPLLVIHLSSKIFWISFIMKVSAVVYRLSDHSHRLSYHS